jgi:hypothetical protein
VACSVTFISRCKFSLFAKEHIGIWGFISCPRSVRRVGRKSGNGQKEYQLEIRGNLFNLKPRLAQPSHLRETSIILIKAWSFQLPPASYSQAVVEEIYEYYLGRAVGGIIGFETRHRYNQNAWNVCARVA